MGTLRGWLGCAMLLAGCAKIIGIEDYQRRDAAIIDAVDAPPDAPFGMFATYVKASNAAANDAFGTALALSADGSTLVVGAPAEDSAALGIDGDQASNAAVDAGAIYVFARSGTSWMQQAYIKASNTGAGDRFGASIAVSADGSTIAIGAPQEDSSSVGINAADNNGASNAGAVYVLTRSGTTWSQQAYVKASNTGTTDAFGTVVALSQDGNTLAVGAPNEDSNATGINGPQNNADPSTEGTNFGAVYVYVRANGVWVQQAYVKASNTGNTDGFGQALALSSDGDTLAVGAPTEDSSALAINGNQTLNNAADAGAVYVLKRVAGIWAQQAYIKATNTGAGDNFGITLALAGDGDTLAVGAHLEDSNGTGVAGANNNLATSAGAAYVYAQVASTWTTQAYIKASNTAASDQFGIAVTLSENGNGLLVGANLEDGSSDGLGGNEADNAAVDAGAAYAFVRINGLWMQSYYLKATNSETTDRYGQAVALSGGGGVFAIGALQEDSAAIGIDGDQASNAAANAGAIYVLQ